MALPRWSDWLNLFLTADCPLCQRSTAKEFCDSCHQQLQRCQLPDHCAAAGPLPVFAWGHYNGVLKRTIGLLKYEQKPQLSRPLAQWLAQAWLASAPSRPQVIVVPIPMHEHKRQQRGFNQAELLAETFCHLTRLPLAKQGLTRSRETTAQFQLSASDRAQNLAGAFSLGAPFMQQRPDRPVLLLDDIYTTGATVNAAAETLRRYGISVSGIVVVARAIRERPAA